MNGAFLCHLFLKPKVPAEVQALQLVVQFGLPHSSGFDSEGLYYRTLELTHLHELQDEADEDPCHPFLVE